jgi:putative transposase
LLRARSWNRLPGERFLPGGRSRPVESGRFGVVPHLTALYENHVQSQNSSLFRRNPMGRLLQPLLLYLAAATDRELARMIEFLKEENRILRGKLPGRITVTPKERQRLLKYGRGLGTAIRELITIVSPRTFARWLSGETVRKKGTRKPGRPKTAVEIRDLVLKVARDNGWGYTRILGELKKLRIAISRSTVVAILKEHGLDPGPKRGEGTWSEFVKRHADTLWACDFFTKKVWTKCGLTDVFVLFFIHVGTRRVHVTGMTTNPDEAWVVQQARNFGLIVENEKATHLIMDMDAKFSAKFRDTLEAGGLEVVRVGPWKPNLNAFAERFVQSFKGECLDHFVCFGEEHLRHIVAKYLEFYNRHRPHQGRDNRTLPDADAEEPATIPFRHGDVVCQEELSGLLMHYYRKSA